MDLALTDATGSGADVVPVAIRLLSAARPAAAPAPAAARPYPVTAAVDLAINETYLTGL
jgi:hypothetical protein